MRLVGRPKRSFLERDFPTARSNPSSGINDDGSGPVAFLHFTEQVQSSSRLVRSPPHIRNDHIIRLVFYFGHSIGGGKDFRYQCTVLPEVRCFSGIVFGIIVDPKDSNAEKLPFFIILCSQTQLLCQFFASNGKRLYPTRQLTISSDIRRERGEVRRFTKPFFNIAA